MRSHSNVGSRRNFSARKPSLPPEEDKLSLYDKLCLDQFSYQNRPPDTRSVKKQPGIYSPRGVASPALTNSPNQKKHVDIMDELDEIVAGLEASQSKIVDEKEAEKTPVKIYEYKSPLRSSNRYSDNPKASMAAKVMGSASNLTSSLLQDSSEYQLSTSYQQLVKPSFGHVPFPSLQTQLTRPERDLGDIFTSHEAWTTFEAAKHFHRKRLAGQIYPPVTYTFPTLPATQTQHPASAAHQDPVSHPGHPYQSHPQPQGQTQTAGLTLPASSPLPKILQKICKHPAFLPLQEPLLAALSAGSDVYLSAPHGSGRAVVYRVLGLASVGFTVVIAPLRRDARMAAHGVQRMDVPCLEEEVENGDRAELRLRKVLEEKKCSFKFLFIAPGWPRITPGFQQALKENHQHKTVQRIVIYDVQALSKLSSEYSDTYLGYVSDVLKSFRTRDPLSEKPPQPAEGPHPLPQIFSLSTETSRFVREDTMDLIGMNKTLFFCNSFWRPNHRHIVTERRQAEIEQLAAILHENYQGVSGLIYVNDFGSCERLRRGIMGELATKTPKSTDIPFTIETFHHGLRDADREKVLTNFMTGVTQVLIIYMENVCMKWDKSDIRFTIHFHLPKSLHHYYTQSGVCGRDGNVADCILLYSSKDVNFFEDRSSHQQTQFSSILKQQGITSNLILNNNDSGWTLGPNRFEFNEMVRYAEERIGCRKQFLCAVYGQVIKKDDCKAYCDNCSANFLLKSSNKIGLVQKIVNFYASVAPSEANQIVTASHHSRNPDLTPKQLVDVLKGTFTPTTSLQEQKLTKAQVLFGVAPDTDKKELEYLILLLLRSGLLKPQPQLSPQGPYTTLSIDPLYHTFYRPLLEGPDCQFSVRMPAKRRNQDAMQPFGAVRAASAGAYGAYGGGPGPVGSLAGPSGVYGRDGERGQLPVVLFEQGSSRFEIERALSAGGEAVLRWVEMGEAGTGYLWRGPEDEAGRTGSSASLERKAAERASTDIQNSKIVHEDPIPEEKSSQVKPQLQSQPAQDVKLPEIDLRHVYDELDDIFEAFACKSSQRSAQDVGSPPKLGSNAETLTDESQLTNLLGLELQRRFELILDSHSKIYNMQPVFDPKIAVELVSTRLLDDKKLAIKMKTGSATDTQMLQLKINQEARHFFGMYGFTKNGCGSPSKSNRSDPERPVRSKKPPSGISLANSFHLNFNLEDYLKPPEPVASDQLYLRFLKLHQMCKLAQPKSTNSTLSNSNLHSSPEKSKIVSEINVSPFEEIFSLNSVIPSIDGAIMSSSIPIPETFVQEHHFKKKLVRPALKYHDTDEEVPTLGKRKPNISDSSSPTLSDTNQEQDMSHQASHEWDPSPTKSDYGVIVVGSDFPEHDYEEPLPPLIPTTKAVIVSANNAIHQNSLPQLIVTSQMVTQTPQLIATTPLAQKPKISTVRIISSPKKKINPAGSLQELAPQTLQPIEPQLTTLSSRATTAQQLSPQKVPLILQHIQANQQQTSPQKQLANQANQPPPTTLQPSPVADPPATSQPALQMPEWPQQNAPKFGSPPPGDHTLSPSDLPQPGEASCELSGPTAAAAPAVAGQHGSAAPAGRSPPRHSPAPTTTPSAPVPHAAQPAATTPPPANAWRTKPS